MLDLKLFIMRLYKKLPILLFDLAAIPTAWCAAYWLRFHMQNFTIDHSFDALKIMFITQAACFYYFKVYRGLWLFSSLKDLIRIIKSVVLAIALVIPIFYLTSLLNYIPRFIFPLYAVSLLTILCSVRLLSRAYHEKRLFSGQENEAKRVLIIGAGDAGECLLRDLKRTNMFWAVGFVDDNHKRFGKEIHGVAVLGTLSDLSRLVIKHNVDLILIAIPSASSADMRRIVNYCEECQLPFRTLPSLSALASGRIQVNELREVNLDDLLGRDQVHLQWDKIVQSIQNKRVLVSGGGGSIGSELCRQILALQPSELFILDHSEYNLYQIGQELQSQYPNCSIKIGLLSVTDQLGVDACFSTFKPQIVFHAAAYKHVPMLEEQVRVAVLNNIIGTRIMAECSVRLQVEKFILISTDKAVNPTNVMGATKRVAEIFCQNFNEQVRTQFITVRFGNVLGSAGSVVPLFKQQIKNGGPVTVTHPDITRYFMTIPEASQLILQAMINGSGGEIFVLDMGEPIKIRYLAEQMIKLSGRQPEEDIQIQYTGLRPGEKLFEELFHESEELAATEHEKLLKACFRKYDWPELQGTLRLLETACHNYQEEELYILLRSLVPEFVSSGHFIETTLDMEKGFKILNHL